MSVTVYIDGSPAEHFEAYRGALEQLGTLPDESNNTFEIWATQLPPRITQRSVWLDPPLDVEQRWLNSSGAIVRSRSVLFEGTQNHGTQDRLLHEELDIRVLCPVHAPINPAILAAFLAHDFPLVDAMMLARAYRGVGWPNDLFDYPVPVGGPYSDAPFAGFPRNAGLYAVVPTSEWVHRLAKAEVPVVQLRNKCADNAQQAIEVRKAMDAVAGTDALLFINDDWKFAMQCRAYGVHLGQEDIEQADLHAMQRAGLRLGISTHGIYEMLRAHTCRPSYMALGAIYATPTKAMPTQPQGLRRLAHYVRLMSPHYPLVAIGGIDLSRITKVWATGVDCAAVLRAIVDASDYRQATADLLATTPRQCVTGVA